MKLKKVLLMCGAPGSGKSTWIQKQIEKNGGIWCSRDAVRFSMLSEKDDYFAHEDEVFNQWISDIRDAINNPICSNIYIDATHITDKARQRVLNRLPNNKFELIYVVFKVPLNICLARNKMREGRGVVPERVIHDMYKSFQLPKQGKIIVINEKGEEEINE